MADDTVPAMLAGFRERNEQRITFIRYTEHTVTHHVAEVDVRRLLAALDAVLEFHRPDGAGSAPAAAPRPDTSATTRSLRASWCSTGAPAVLATAGACACCHCPSSAEPAARRRSRRRSRPHYRSGTEGR